MYYRILLAVACLPSILLLIYVYKKDRVEKEPPKLLLLLFVLGALSCLPAALLESLLSGMYANMLGENTLAYQLAENFLNVALFEEGFKFLFMFLATRKSKHFNTLFDGLIYAVFVSLGFATLENILYVFQYGLQVGLLRAVTAIPGHMFDGVIMGQFYTLWHLSKNISLTEKAYYRNGFIDALVQPEGKYRLYLPLALMIPILTHGLYDFLASSQSVIAFALFFVFLIGLYIFCFGRIRKLSALDDRESNLISAELTRKYPYLPARIQQAMQYNSRMQYNPYSQRTYNPYAPQNDFTVTYR